MTRLALFAAAAALALVATGAQAKRAKAPPKPVGPPAAVMAMTRAALAVDLQGQALPAVLPARAFHAVTITPDGVTDWRFDGADLGQAILCGTGGCQEILVASRGKGAYAVVFDLQASRLTINNSYGPAIVDVDLHPALCGEAGPDACQRRYAWDGLQFSERPNARGESRLTLLVPPTRASGPLPVDVYAAVGAYARSCGRAGLDPDSPGPVSIPDINGDGVRDWVIGPGYCRSNSAQGGPPLGVQVFASQPGGRFAIAYQGAT